MGLDTPDRRLLNVVQAGVPFVERPYHEMGAQLGLSGDEVIERLQNLKLDGTIRWVSGVFDSSKLGYRSTLVAMHVEHTHLDAAAEVINRQPGVSHNYGRDHWYNLWFTLTLPQKESLEEAIRALRDTIHPESVMSLPAIHTFKRRVYFDMMTAADRVGASTVAEESWGTDSKRAPQTFADEERWLVVALQRDLPVRARPFDEMCGEAGTSPEELFGHARALLDSGVMLRFGASISHHKAGFTANALSCWAAPHHEVDEAGRQMARFDAVSHCYERWTNANWPYNLYAMIHGRSKSECEAIVREISTGTGISQYALLWTTAEYKKSKIRYFGENG